MGFALELKRMTAEEFLAWDKTQTVKHEFVRGEVFAMATIGGFVGLTVWLIATGIGTMRGARKPGAVYASCTWVS